MVALPAQHQCSSLLTTTGEGGLQPEGELSPPGAVVSSLILSLLLSAAPTVPLRQVMAFVFAGGLRLPSALQFWRVVSYFYFIVVYPHLRTFFFHWTFFLFLDSGAGGGRGCREKHGCERETSIGPLLHMPHPGPGIKPATEMHDQNQTQVCGLTLLIFRARGRETFM